MVQERQCLVASERAVFEVQLLRGCLNHVLGFDVTQCWREEFRQRSMRHLKAGWIAHGPRQASGNARTTVVVLWNPDMSPASSAISP